jgi:hypothetical protein
MTPTGLRLLQDLRRQLLHPPTQLPARTPADTPIGNHDTVNTAA